MPSFGSTLGDSPRALSLGELRRIALSPGAKSAEAAPAEQRVSPPHRARRERRQLWGAATLSTFQRAPETPASAVGTDSTEVDARHLSAKNYDDSFRERQRAESSMPSSTPEAQNSRKCNPFVVYDAREVRLKLESRWLQEDPAYMDIRMQGLEHNTVQARLDKEYGVDLGSANASAEAPWQCGKPAVQGRKLQKSHSEPLEAKRYGCKRGAAERCELTAMKNLQSEMRKSALQVDGSLGSN